jgi:hypothetical protein
VTPGEGVHWLSALTVPWWIAGGWALDLYTGSRSRPHKDLDIGILRRDAVEVISSLRAWEFFEAKDGALTPINSGRAPRADVHSLWCRPVGSMQWLLEFMLDESRGDRWVFRRELTIERPLSETIRRDLEGMPYLAPEIQLLYKARATRIEDQADFDRVVPRLEPEARRWLERSLAKVHPDHRWLSLLRLGSDS